MQHHLNGQPFPSRDDPLWYKDAIIYELHVRAFADSNGDGIGDFRGLTQKLDYLEDLGVTVVWLLPFYPSPLRDDGYDIADYGTVHSAYGTLADFQTFLHEAHRRGLRVITELVINHTSDQHPWFQRARRAPPGSPERDFYVWTDDPKKFSEARIIFKDFEASNWTWDPVAQAYYWHRFYHHQPDLNYDNPEVHKATFEVLDFWLNMGVDGLRLDAVPYLYEREGTNCENLPETHRYLKDLRRHVDEKFRGRMLLAEANQWPEDAIAYFGDGDECHMNFHFPLMPRLFMALRMEDRFPILDILAQTPPIPPTCQWALFLRNHDELTLEMVTDEDRDYMYRIYGQDPQARINLGIRRRLAPLLENHRGKIELMNGLLLSLPGTPVLYYGDEIGMGDNIYLGDRNGVRTPMQWSAERNAGFSKANPQRLYLPVIIDPAYHFESLNVEVQQNDLHSLLWWMKRLIALRKRHSAFGRGSLQFLSADNPKVLAFVRRLESPDQSLLVVANLSRSVQHAQVDLSGFQGLVPVEMLGRTRFPVIAARPYFLTLGGYSFIWFSLQPEHAERSAVVESQELPLLQAEDWNDLLRGAARERLEDVLPDFLARCPWFQGTNRGLDTATMIDAVAMVHDSTTSYLTLVRVAYTEGEPETYLLPLAAAFGALADHVQKERPPALIARLQWTAANPDGSEAGILYDPTGEPVFAAALVDAVAMQGRFPGLGSEVVGVPSPLLHSVWPVDASQPSPIMMGGEHSHTILVWTDRLALKMFRRVEEGPNPEPELCQLFAERTSFRQAPPLLGTLEYRQQPPGITLAVLQGFVPNQGDAWHYVIDALGRYYEQALTRHGQIVDLTLPRKPLLQQVEDEVPARAQEVLGSILERGRLLGQLTGEMHLALASLTDLPDFAPEPFTMLYQRSLYQSLRSVVRQTLELLRSRQTALAPGLQEVAVQLLASEEELLRRARRIFDQKMTALRCRCHGDYHLAQVLYTGKDFVIVDWEGEANRPLSDRRRKRSPLRDVASMVYSFHHAAHSAMKNGTVRPEDGPGLKPWARYWLHWMSVAFLRAYLERAREGSFLPEHTEELAILLQYSLLKRATNELRQDLRDRPQRLEASLLALQRCLG
jgi:maltose alpha-D-glucosyltransferase/alpha-amylase